MKSVHWMIFRYLMMFHTSGSAVKEVCMFIHDTFKGQKTVLTVFDMSCLVKGRNGCTAGKATPDKIICATYKSCK